jgi:ELWxxDGT repeat protein
MKNISLTNLFVFLFSTTLFSQSFVILDESPQSSGLFFDGYYDFVVYDNDILYTKNIAPSGFIPLTRLNYGIPNNYIDFNLQGSFSFSDHHIVSRFNFYEANQKKIGSKIILQSTSNGPYNGTIFSLNNSRSNVLIEPDFNNNFNLIGKDLAISSRIEEDLETNNDYIVLKLHTANDIEEFALPSYLTSGQPGAFFLWDNNIYFTADDGSGGRELFKTDAFQTTRVTKLRIPNALNSTSPGSFFKRDSEFLYFSGNYRTFNAPPQTGNTNFGRELCYTTGNPNLGSTETHVSGNDDGSTGYIAFQTGVPSPTNYSGSAPIILGKTNDKIIYYATNSYMRNFYSHPGNISLGLTGPELGDITRLEYLELHDKLYLSYIIGPEAPLPHRARLYQTNGTPEGTILIPIPTVNAGGSVFEARSIRELFVHNDKIYYRAFYNIPQEITKFIEYNPESEQSTILFDFPDGSGNLVKPYTSGFVFNGNGKLYGWNIESRAAVMSLNTNEIMQNTQFTSNGVNFSFSFDVIQSVLNTDQIKINLLDNLSIPSEFIINQGQNNTDSDNDIQLSKLFYSMIAFDENNIYNSNITLGYDESMFDTIESFNPDYLTVKAFSNGEWIYKNISNIDAINKTVTISDTFNNEEYLFFEYNEALSINDNQLSEVIIYPNPGSESITIHFSENTNYKVSIIDFSGKTIATHDLSNTSTININQLSTGIYIVKIQKENGVSYNQKLIVN